MIKVFLADVDGTLSNGTYQMGEDGSLSKGFYSRDFHGMSLLDKVGVKVGIISMSNDKVINEQCARAASYARLFTGVRNKAEFVNDEFMLSGLYHWSEIAFIGDDVIDVGLLKMAGWAACPIDSHSTVLETIREHSNGSISSYGGGCGAVREFADDIMDSLRRLKDGKPSLDQNGSIVL